MDRTYARETDQGVMKHLDSEIGQNNVLLLAIARKTVNSSPEPRYKVKMRDEIKAMMEKERVGFSFNKGLRDSLGSRWKVVENATVDFLTELTKMNDQVEDDNRRFEHHLTNLIVTRTSNLSLSSRIEQMAGLFVHLNFYLGLLERKTEQYGRCKTFLQTCSDLLGYAHPANLMDRLATLKHIGVEIIRSNEEKLHELNKLYDTLSEVRSEEAQRHMMMHNQKAELQSRLEEVQKESSELEKFINIRMDTEMKDSAIFYRVKHAINHIYLLLMNYRGFELKDTDPLSQLEEIAVRLESTIAVVKSLHGERGKRQRRVTKSSRQKRSSFTDSKQTGELDDESDEDSAPSHFTSSNVNANWQCGLQFKASSRSRLLTPQSGSVRSRTMSRPPERSYGCRSGLLPSITQHRSLLSAEGRIGLHSAANSFRSLNWSRERFSLRPNRSGLITMHRGSASYRGSRSMLEGWTSKSMDKDPCKISSYTGFHPLPPARISAEHSNAGLKEGVSSVQSQRIPVQNTPDRFWQSRTQMPWSIHASPALSNPKKSMLKSTLELIDEKRQEGRLEAVIPPEYEAISSPPKRTKWPIRRIVLDPMEEQPASINHEMEDITTPANTRQPKPENKSSLSEGAPAKLKITSSNQRRRKKGSSAANDVANGERGQEVQPEISNASSRSFTKKYLKENYLNILADIRLSQSSAPKRP